MSRTRHAGPPSNAGFTLIELMIVVVVIGILAAIAMPMYGDSVTRSKIIDGTTQARRLPHADGKVFHGQPDVYQCGAALRRRRSGGRAPTTISISPASAAPGRRDDLHDHGHRHRRTRHDAASSTPSTRRTPRRRPVPGGKYTNRLLGGAQGRVLLMFRARAAGFTLIELMIGLAIAGLLLVLAMPSYSVWIADGQIRNAAESIASGMRYAQSQAVARNSAVAFILTTGNRVVVRPPRNRCVDIANGGLRRGLGAGHVDTDARGGDHGHFQLSRRDCRQRGRERDADGSGYHVRDGGGRRAQSPSAGREEPRRASRSAIPNGRRPIRRAARPDDPD